MIVGAKKFLANKSYEGEVSFKLASSADTNPKDKMMCNSGYVHNKMWQF